MRKRFIPLRWLTLFQFVFRVTIPVPLIFKLIILFVVTVVSAAIRVGLRVRLVRAVGMIAIVTEFVFVWVVIRSVVNAGVLAGRFGKSIVTAQVIRKPVAVVMSVVAAATRRPVVNASVLAAFGQADRATARLIANWVARVINVLAMPVVNANVFAAIGRRIKSATAPVTPKRAASAMPVAGGVCLSSGLLYLWCLLCRPLRLWQMAGGCL
jgi:hypothetical protein